MPKHHGWYPIGGKWYLTWKAACKEFNLTEAQWDEFYNSPLAKAVENFPYYPYVGTSKSVWVWKLADLKAQMPHMLQSLRDVKC